MALPQAVSNSNKRTFYVLSFISILDRATYIPPEGESFAHTDIKLAAQFPTVNAAIRRVNSKQWAHANLRLVRVEETTVQAGESRRLLAETESAPTFGTQDVVKYALNYTPWKRGFAYRQDGGALGWARNVTDMDVLLFNSQGDALAALVDNAVSLKCNPTGREAALVRVLVSPAKPVVTLTETVLS